MQAKSDMAKTQALLLYLMPSNSEAQCLDCRKYMSIAFGLQHTLSQYEAIFF